MTDHNHAPLALPASETREVNLPFQGFYESIWSGAVDSHVEQTCEHFREMAQYEAERFADDFPLLDPSKMNAALWDALSELYSCHAVNYGAAYRALAGEYAGEFGAWLAETLDLESSVATFSAMDSPKFYNFETDRVFAIVPLPILREIHGRLSATPEGRETLCAEIRERHSSCSGFISFYSADCAVWHGKPLVEWDHNELATLLIAWGRSHDVHNFDELLYDYRCGGLYEEVYHATDAATDWARLATVTLDELQAMVHRYTRLAA